MGLRTHSNGYTLIEVLVAFTILALALTVLLRIFSGGLRNVSVSSDGERVIFLRSAAGDDPANALWVLDVATGFTNDGTVGLSPRPGTLLAVGSGRLAPEAMPGILAARDRSSDTLS